MFIFLQEEKTKHQNSLQHKAIRKPRQDTQNGQWYKMTNKSDKLGKRKLTVENNQEIEIHTLLYIYIYIYICVYTHTPIPNYTLANV